MKSWEVTEDARGNHPRSSPCFWGVARVEVTMSNTTAGMMRGEYVQVTKTKGVGLGIVALIARPRLSLQDFTSLVFLILSSMLFDHLTQH